MYNPGIVSLSSADSGFHALVHDLVRRHGNGLQTRRTEPIHGGCGSGNRQSSQNRHAARQVGPLRAVRSGTSDDRIFDFGGIERIASLPREH